MPGPYNSYLASVLADLVRRELLEAGRTFTFETVMSSRDKVDFMKEARAKGYRVHLYFVATDDPAINMDRVRRRVKLGGHPLPARKIRERYASSIGLMTEACEIAHRAYVFDNSGSKRKLLAQVVDGERMEIEVADPAALVRRNRAVGLLQRLTGIGQGYLCISAGNDLSQGRSS